DCSLSQSLTHTPDRPGARPSIRPAPVVSASTKLVSPGSRRSQPAAPSTHRTARARFSPIPRTRPGSGSGHPLAAAAPRPACAGRDRLRLLRERASRAGRFETSQAPLAPPQLDRLPAGVQVLDPHHRSVLAPAGGHPARRAGCFPVAMLDDDAKVILAEPFDA